MADGVNSSFKEIMRSDLDSDPQWGLRVDYYDPYCTSGKARPALDPYSYTRGPFEVPCPDGSSGCHQYERSNLYIILDQRNRLVKTDYNAVFTYFDDYPTLDMFAISRCSGIEAPAPTVSICPEPSSSSTHPSSSHSPSSSLPSSVPSSSTHASSSILVAVAAALAALIASF